MKVVFLLFILVTQSQRTYPKMAAEKQKPAEQNIKKEYLKKIETIILRDNFHIETKQDNYFIIRKVEKISIAKREPAEHNIKTNT